MSSPSNRKMATIFSLTTPFTPPASCLTAVYNYNNTDWRLGTYSQSECFPTKFFDGGNVSYYPDVCPESYTINCSNSDLSSSVHWSLCCPIGYSCASMEGAVIRHCTKTLTSPIPCTRIPDMVVATLPEGFGVLATGVPVAAAPAGQPPTPSTNTSSNLTTTNPQISTPPVHDPENTSAQTVVPSGAPSATLEPHSINRGRSVKAIAISIPITIALGILVFFLFRYWKHTRSAPAEVETQGNQIMEIDSTPPNHELGDPSTAILAGRTVAARSPVAYGLPVDMSRVSRQQGFTNRPAEISETRGTTHFPFPTPFNTEEAMTSLAVQPQVLTTNHSIVQAMRAEAGSNSLQEASASARQTTCEDHATEDEELHWMIEEQERLNERRERLKRLEEIDAAEARLKQQIRERLAVLNRRSP